MHTETEAASSASANDWWGQTYRQAFDAQKPTQALSILTGCSAGATESVVVVPFELVKIRLQDRNSAGRYKGPMDCVSQILKNEGVLGFYNGLEPTFWRYVDASKLYMTRHKLTRASVPSTAVMLYGMAVISDAYFK